MTRMKARSNGDGDTASSIVPHVQEYALPEVPERPALAPDVELVGKMPETGFSQQQWLIQRDGKFLQVTELLYRVAEQINGEKTLEEIAEGVTASTEWLVSADNVRQLIQAKLIPPGIVVTADGLFVREQQAPSPLAVNMRKRVIGPQIIDPIARVLQVLYRPPILIAILIIAAAAHIWLYAIQGMTSIILDVVYRPWTLFIIIGVMMLGAIFHEFGHAAALRYGGGKIRGMGVGFYLIYPAFYTDVTDSYRLGRWARVRTDLGGFYFYLIFALGIMGLYWITGDAFLLLIVVLINIDIIYQLLPFVRLDGYWALADLTGIPDFFSQMVPFLASILPIPGYEGDKLPNLKPWVKIVFIGYIIITIPILIVLYILMIQRLPLFLVITWESLGTQIKLFTIAQNNQSTLAMVVLIMQMLLLVLLAVGILYVFFRVILMVIGGLLNAAETSQRMRIISWAGIVAFVAFIAALWIPQLVLARTNTEAPDSVQSFTVNQRDHVETPVKYDQNPPVGGNHALIWQNCGFYDTPIANENGVHSMEHGAVWITYRPDLPKDQIELLRQWANSQPYVLASAYPDLPAPVVASAWGRQLRLDSATDQRLNQFIHTFRLDTQAPESGGECTGGIGVPR